MRPFRPGSLVCLSLLLAALFASPVAANWTATGLFVYVDREFDQTGFTGVETLAPVRRADVEVVDANANGPNAILAAGVTGLDGSFSIPVTDNKTRSVYVRAVTRSNGSPNLFVDVRVSSSGNAQYYAAATGTISSHPPSVNVNFGTFVIDIGQGGEAFNIYDQLVRGIDYLTFLNGAPPTSGQHLTAVWSTTNGVTSSFYDSSNMVINARDSSGYDDTVILHEMGHFTIREYSESDAFGGSHTFSMCFIDLRLAFEEGWATFWGNSVLRYLGLPRSNIYTRTNGGGGPGHLVRYADVETDTQYRCQGSTSELNVAMLLWDLADGSATPDTTPGVDDAHDSLSLDDHEIWEVMTGQLPGSLNVSMEVFWDGWFAPPVQNGNRVEMMAIGEEIGVEYFEDIHEENNSPASAAHVLTNGFPVHSTFFRDPEQDGEGAADVDLFSFNALGSSEYVLETKNLLGDGNTFLRLFDSDGTTLLALNDNRASGDDSSRLVWIAPHAGTFFAQVSHAPDAGIYGSYDLTILGVSPTPAGSSEEPPPSGLDGDEGDEPEERFLPARSGGG